MFGKVFFDPFSLGLQKMMQTTIRTAPAQFLCVFTVPIPIPVGFASANRTGWHSFWVRGASATGLKI
jgi:hypothetical protein